jgi:hypothetical protein
MGYTVNSAISISSSTRLGPPILLLSWPSVVEESTFLGSRLLWASVSRFEGCSVLRGISGIRLLRSMEVLSLCVAGNKEQTNAVMKKSCRTSTRRKLCSAEHAAPRRQTSGHPYQGSQTIPGRYVRPRSVRVPDNCTGAYVNPRLSSVYPPKEEEV